MSCGFGETNPSSNKINKSLFSLDSLSKVFPDYELSYSEDSTVCFLNNYLNNLEKREYLIFDSVGNYRAYARLENGSAIYGASYDDSLNVIEESGSIFHVTMLNCYSKEDSTLFWLYPVTPPFFSSHFELFYRESISNSYKKIFDQSLNNGRDLEFQNTRFASGGELLGIITMKRENYEKKDTFEIQIFDCEN